MAARQKTLGAFAAALLALSLLFLFFIPATQAQDAPAYIELVRQKTDCPAGGCFDEYLFLPNGIAVRKLLDTPDYKGLPRMDIRKIDAAGLFAEMEKFRNSIPAVADEPHGFYELFYLKGKRLYIFSTRQAPPPQLAALAQKADRLFAAGDGGTQDFYLHEYHQPLGGAGHAPTEDTHIFSDGTVIYSLFSEDTNQLLDSRMGHATPGDMKQIRRLAGMAMLAPARDMPCPPESGLVYGHMEIRRDGSLRQFETCGRDDSEASALFRYILEKLPVAGLKKE